MSQDCCLTLFYIYQLQCCGAGAGLFVLAGAGAGEKALAPVRIHKVVTIYTQIKRKNRYTLKKPKLLTLVFQNCIFT